MGTRPAQNDDGAGELCLEAVQDMSFRGSTGGSAARSFPALLAHLTRHVRIDERELEAGGRN
jgi:hypothetical protein